MNPDNRYDDMLYMEHPVSKRHIPMSLHDRAAQFAPFAALTGYDAAIRETGRLTDSRIELDEAQQHALDEAVKKIAESFPQRLAVEIRHFVADKKKAGGEYVTSRGRVRNLELPNRLVVMDNGDVILLDDIVSMVFVDA